MIKIFWVYPGLYALQALKALIPLLNITDKLKKKPDTRQQRFQTKIYTQTRNSTNSCCVVDIPATSIAF